MKEKNLKIKLNMIYLMIYGAMACYFPFLTIYFKNKGLNYAEIGIALALNSLVSIIAQPIWGYVTDKYLNKRSALILSILSSAVAMFMFIFARGLAFTLVALMIYMTFQSPIGSIVDSYCYDIIEENKEIQYGRIRLMGSIGYAILAALIGVLIKYTGIISSAYVYLFMAILLFIIINSIKFNGKSSGYKIDIKDIAIILRDKRFFIFILSVIMINISMGANGSYIAVLLEKTGGDVSKLGILWFVVAMSELPLFFLGGKLLKKLGDMDMYILCLFIFFIRYLLDSITKSYTSIIIIQLMQGVTFPLYLVACMNYINRIVPERMRTSGITLYAAIGGGLGGFIGNISGGIIIQSFDVFTLFKILSVSSIVAMFLAIILKKVDNLEVIN